MSFRLRTKLGWALAVARILVAAVLLIDLLAGGVAQKEVTSGAQLCTMECCVGKAAHLIGECSMGAAPACHAHFPVADAPNTHQVIAPTSPADPIGGGAEIDAGHAHKLHRSEQSVPFVQSIVFRRHQLSTMQRAPDNSSLPVAQFAAGSLSQPCQPNCSAGALNSSPGHRTNKSATLIAVVRPRPPTGAVVSPYHCLLIPADAALLEASRPRGPPALFS